MIIIKLLGLTQSSNDHEALSSIRKANELLKNQKMTWGELFSGAKVFVERVEVAPKKKSRNDKVLEMFAAVKSSLQAQGSPAIDFIEDIERKFHQYGSLTPNQMNALKKFYARVSQEYEEEFEDQLG